MVHRVFWRSIAALTRGCLRSAAYHLNEMVGFPEQYHPLYSRGLLHFLWFLLKPIEGGLALRLRHLVARGLFARCGKGVTLRPGVSIYDGRALSIGDHVSIGNGSYIGGGPVNIGDNVRMARYVVIETFDHHFNRLDIPIRLQDGQNKPVVIEEDVWIGVRVTICPGVRIGRGSVIGAGSVVTRNIPEYSVAAGVPARVIRSRSAQQDGKSPV